MRIDDFEDAEVEVNNNQEESDDTEEPAEERQSLLDIVLDILDGWIFGSEVEKKADEIDEEENEFIADDEFE